MDYRADRSSTSIQHVSRTVRAVASLQLPRRTSDLGTNFHTSYMPVVAVGCTAHRVASGTRQSSRGHGGRMTRQCATVAYAYRGCGCGGIFAYTLPSNVNLPTNGRKWESGVLLHLVLRVMQQTRFNSANTSATERSCFGCEQRLQRGTTACGHTMGGAPIRPPARQRHDQHVHSAVPALTVNVEPSPLPTSTVYSVVFGGDWRSMVSPSLRRPGHTLPVHEVVSEISKSCSGRCGQQWRPTGQMTYTCSICR